MATIWASLNRPFFILQSSGRESYAFLYPQLALDSGKRTGLVPVGQGQVGNVADPDLVSPCRFGLVKQPVRGAAQPMG